jgi:uncharacterized membrane protein
MITTIGFFNNKHESNLGTIRGLIAFPIVLILGSLWYFYLLTKIDKTTKIKLSFKSVISLLISALILVSAVGVQLPKDTKTAVVYGALVGLSVFGIRNLFNIAHGAPILSSTTDVVFGILLTSLCSFTVHKSGFY